MHVVYVCVSVCVYMCVCTGFCYPFRTSSGVNTDCVRTSSPHEDQRPVQMRHDLISAPCGPVVRFRGKV